ncbi:MAG: hypothetical protein LBJ11_01765 [Oscillospiraceae bacterium]|nr:hypothetical protein [Oscillospiraceae bacterium]
MKDNRVQLATIFLEYGGYNLRTSELSGITQTDRFYEVRDASALTDVFNKIHTDLFDSAKRELGAGKNIITVPPNGVNMLNFIFEQDSPDALFELTDPLGAKTYTKSDAVLMGNLCVLSIANPTAGWWYCNLSGGTATEGETGTKSSLLASAENFLQGPVGGLAASSVLSIPTGLLTNWLYDKIKPPEKSAANVIPFPNASKKAKRKRAVAILTACVVAVVTYMGANGLFRPHALATLFQFYSA